MIQDLYWLSLLYCKLLRILSLLKNLSSYIYSDLAFSTNEINNCRIFFKWEQFLLSYKKKRLIHEYKTICNKDNKYSLLTNKFFINDEDLPLKFIFVQGHCIPARNRNKITCQVTLFKTRTIITKAEPVT
jgi:hypothetical protein